MFTDIRKRGEKPRWMGEEVWAQLSALWATPEYVKKREQNRRNRASDVGGLGSSLHTGGSVPHTEHRRRLAAALGREPTPLELHQHTHQRKETKEWVDAKAKKAFDDFNVASAASSVGDSPLPSSPTGAYALWSQVVGGHQRGRTYGLGAQAAAYEAASSRPAEHGDSYMQEHMAAMKEQMRADVLREVRAELGIVIETEVQTRVQEEMRKLREEEAARLRSMSRAEGKAPMIVEVPNSDSDKSD